MKSLGESNKAMKVTRKQLRRIIKEELEKINEDESSNPALKDRHNSVEVGLSAACGLMSGACVKVYQENEDFRVFLNTLVLDTEGSAVDIIRDSWEEIKGYVGL